MSSLFWGLLELAAGIFAVLSGAICILAALQGYYSLMIVALVLLAGNTLIFCMSHNYRKIAEAQR